MRMKKLDSLPIITCVSVSYTHLDVYKRQDMGKDGMHGTAMPVNYVVEMFCDRVTATKIYQKDKYTDQAPYEYYPVSYTHLDVYKRQAQTSAP